MRYEKRLCDFRYWHRLRYAMFGGWDGALLSTYGPLSPDGYRLCCYALATRCPERFAKKANGHSTGNLQGCVVTMRMAYAKPGTDMIYAATSYFKILVGYDSLSVYAPAMRCPLGSLGYLEWVLRGALGCSFPFYTRCVTLTGCRPPCLASDVFTLSLSRARALSVSVSVSVSAVCCTICLISTDIASDPLFHQH
eukprot:2874220-Rhodomonas_salina.2